jgi:hypothetical protein
MFVLYTVHENVLVADHTLKISINKYKIHLPQIEVNKGNNKITELRKINIAILFNSNDEFLE